MQLNHVFFGCCLVGTMALQGGPSIAQQRQWPTIPDLPSTGVQIVAAQGGRVRLQIYDPANQVQQFTDASSIELEMRPEGLFVRPSGDVSIGGRVGITAISSAPVAGGLPGGGYIMKVRR